MKYLIAGISIINDIVYADGRQKKGRLGGCGIFAYGGIAMFTDSVALISSAGEDFWEYYGSYFDENDIDRKGIYQDLPHTHHTVLTYEKDGRWSERSIYGDDYFALQEENNRTSYAKLESFLSEESIGLYLDSKPTEKIFAEIPLIRQKAEKIRIMWEPPTFCSKDPSLHEKMLEALHETDYYSMNLDEASAFFDGTSRAETIEKIRELDIPCFLREGEQGSSWIEDRKITSLKAYRPDQAIDVTGCGNCSAAAALYWKIEGKDAFDIVMNANIAAGCNALADGPPEVRRIREEKICTQMKKYYQEEE